MTLNAREAIAEMRSWCHNKTTHHAACGCQLAAAIEAELDAREREVAQYKQFFLERTGQAGGTDAGE